MHESKVSKLFTRTSTSSCKSGLLQVDFCRIFPQPSSHNQLAEKINTFFLFQKTLGSFRCTKFRFRILSFWALRAICSAIIPGLILKKRAGPSTPSNGTKRTKSFLGECGNDTNATSRRKGISCFWKNNSGQKSGE